MAGRSRCRRALIGTMPAHKNQHYVPRCYMRPFSVDGEGKAINLHNIRSARSVQGAPMKNQCSAPYIYGKEDLRLEHALGEIETAYARALRKVIAGRSATGEDIGYLLAFMMLQFSRTKAAVERLRSMITGVEREVRSSTSGRLPETDTSARAMMLSSLRLYERVTPAVLDLRPCFLKNKSRVEFRDVGRPRLFHEPVPCEAGHPVVRNRLGWGDVLYAPDAKAFAVVLRPQRIHGQADWSDSRNEVCARRGSVQRAAVLECA